MLVDRPVARTGITQPQITATIQGNEVQRLRVTTNGLSGTSGTITISYQAVNTVQPNLSTTVQYSTDRNVLGQRIQDALDTMLFGAPGSGNIQVVSQTPIAWDFARWRFRFFT